MSNANMLETMAKHNGFIAALDQSGGSTPKALALYGISEEKYQNSEQMFSLVHKMRERIVTNPSFNSEKVIGAILFEHTLNGTFADKPAAQYLWQEKGILPFLKVDQGLTALSNGIQLMKEIPELTQLLNKAVDKGVFGTKMRSLILQANEQGINELVEQQFTYAKKIISSGLIPIIEPEIDINSPEKYMCEELLKTSLLNQLNQLNNSQKVMLKLSLPEQGNFYQECSEHSNVLRVVALSGGYTREQANQKLSKNDNMIASFSRALTQGLHADQTNEDFTASLSLAVNSIYLASMKKQYKK